MRFRSSILEVHEYRPPLHGRKSSGEVLLDFNERTDPLPPAVLRELADWFLEGATQVYPEYPGLLEALAETTGMPQDHLFFGVGSDQLIDCVFRAVVDPGDAALIPTPSFAMYAHAAALAQADVRTFDMLADDLAQAADEALAARPTRIAVFGQPNNPTGGLIPTLALLDLVRDNPDTWFLVDEAYAEFSGESLLSRVARQYPANLIVARTFSKAYGLAALRVGYVVASPPMVTQLAKIRGPYDLSTVASHAVQVVLRHRDDVLAYVREVMDVHKPRVELALRVLGIPFLPSRANFLLIPDGVALLADRLKAHGIRGRVMGQPELKGCLRISIGGAEATRRLLDALEG